jgi:hypothetical protein
MIPANIVKAIQEIVNSDSNHEYDRFVDWLRENEIDGPYHEVAWVDAQARSMQSDCRYCNLVILADWLDSLDSA